MRNSNKTVSEKGTVPFCSAELGQSPTVLLEFINEQEETEEAEDNFSATYVSSC
jgi:hypothetical protein